MLRKMGGRHLLAISLLLLTSAVSCLSPNGVDRVAAPYGESTIGYHFKELAKRIGSSIQGQQETGLPADEQVALVEEYFTLTGQIQRHSREVGDVRAQSNVTLAALTGQLDWARQRRDLVKPQVETIVSHQVGDALRQAGLAVALGPKGPDWFFPPSQFFLLQPPFVLVTSPRDRIEINGSYLLAPQLSTATIENIEGRAEAEGVSALVERTGGFSLYPAWVSEDDSLRDTLDTVAHEWSHAYLFLFSPLGRGYFRDYQMRTINETVADMIGKEVGEAVYQRYYAPQELPISPTASSAARTRGAEFAVQMRQIRAAVDGMLTQGRV
ncbi:MAG: hypothetical protein Q8P59_11170, partial [Dehalococcoidia bacterium]|nr:hypothetical protein [Dehalococcoidia bacterium]